VAERALPVLAELVDELADTDERQTAMVVAHGGTISALTASTLGWPVSAWHSLQPLHNCAWAVLEQRFVAQSQLLSCTPSIAPVRGILTDGFGGRSDPFTGVPGYHQGLDISTEKGQPVYATADGRVDGTRSLGGRLRPCSTI